jgi:predicted membrane protein
LLHEEFAMKYFRPVIISILTAAMIVGFFTDRVEAAEFGVFAFGLIVWWFKSRDEAKSKGGS